MNPYLTSIDVVVNSMYRAKLTEFICYPGCSRQTIIFPLNEIVLGYIISNGIGRLKFENGTVFVERYVIFWKIPQNCP
jgi:hypothetical protein